LSAELDIPFLRPGLESPEILQYRTIKSEKTNYTELNMNNLGSTELDDISFLKLCTRVMNAIFINSNGLSVSFL